MAYKKIKYEELTPEFRLQMIAKTIEGVDNRCMAVDGPVTPTKDEINESELRVIYQAAIGKTIKY